MREQNDPVRHIAFDAQLALLENSLSRYTRNLVRHLLLLKPDLRVSLLVFSDRRPEELLASHSWVPSGAKFVVMRGKETPHHLSTAERIRRRFIATPITMRAIGAQIYQAHYTDFPIPFGFKVVTTLHDIFQWIPELGRMRGGLSSLRKCLDKITYRQAAIISVSDSTLRDFQTHLDRGHKFIKRIYSGNDPVFSPSPNSADRSILEKYCLNENSYFLYIGDLTPRKDVKTLIRAFHLALPELPADFRLAISKGHWTVCPERDLVQELGIADRVSFLGHIPEADLPILYRACFGFVFPSLYEGFGFPPIEAMASGVPVISTNHSALTEIVGPAGLTFQRGDAPTLATLMLKLIDNPGLRRECITKGLEHASQFSWTNTAQQVLDVYRDLLSSESEIAKS